MKISTNDFLQKYKELYISHTPNIATLAYWKMKHLIEEGESFYLPNYDCYYMIRDKHLLVYYSPDNQFHISVDEINSLNCISLPAIIYDSIKDQLIGFNDSRSWGLRYDFNFNSPQTSSLFYEVIDFDFNNQNHFEKAAEIINGGNEWLNDNNIKKMTTYSAFDPSLWFFVKDKVTQELIAISISAYSNEVRQTDLDWIYVLPQYQGKGAGRYLIGETIRRCRDKSDDICVGGTADFYRKCGFYNYELWVWSPKDGYNFNASSIQP